ncbi:HeH/LEM domain-containing protein [uncultured Anaerococcus sp.]|uniref:HeH/LEM domain-containing protein n=1 Tax=uncultured Anaerococcus sp. TaxID=293428 RepID=UPI0025D48EB0|nr:HeH/LEM domain-containing protein [uncultured Anaerococcus sp.]
MFYKAKSPKGDIIKVTSKTYRVLYRSRGYVLIDDEVVSKKENTDDKKDYKDMTVKELKSLLDKKKIPYKGNDKKDKLIELIEG